MKQERNTLLFKVIFIVTALFTSTLFITTLASTARVTGDEIVIIDVRTLDEWNAGHLATAEHLQLDRVAESIDTVVLNKNQQVYLYCRSGNRSGQAKIIMDSLGYTNVTNAGGLDNASELLAIEIVQ
jgi:phage shock protein E